MNHIVERIAACQATNDDYVVVMRLLGYELRPNARMYRRLSCRRGGIGAFQGVPDLTNAHDAELWLNSYLMGQFKIRDKVMNGKRIWWIDCCGQVVSSSSLGGAIWAAFVAARL